MTIFYEVQCDGLIGPTHNYAGLSVGNVASQSNADSVSYPRQAALQGLDKMRVVHHLGCKQLILPPPLRPNMALIRQCGADITTGKQSPEQLAIMRSAWSASTMWSANAATVSPAPDTGDHALHITIANLVSGIHRAQEALERHALFNDIFGGIATIHAPLPASTPLSDEGAANHMRLSPGHGEAGVELFVYGKDNNGPAPTRYPARQTRMASALIAQMHQLPESRFVLSQQHPDAIDAGVFHNDVIAMSNEHVMIYHELTFLDEHATCAELQEKADFPLTLIRISNDTLPIEDAVCSYLYNSQLISLPDGNMAILAPIEAENNNAAHAVLQAIKHDSTNPISAVHYLDVRESMSNGGGPACLRLRVAMNEQQWHAIPACYHFTDARYKQLSDFISRHYPETLTAQSLSDATLAQKMHETHRKLMALFADI